MRASLDLVRSIAVQDHGLAAVATLRTSGTAHLSLVNAGVVDHPLDHEPVLAFVARGASAKLRHLRVRPWASLLLRSGWEWVSVEGRVELAGPDDPLHGLDPVRVPGLLRNIFLAAGGTHEDFEEYDRVMAAEHRTAVLVRCERVTTNSPSSVHIEQGG